MIGVWCGSLPTTAPRSATASWASGRRWCACPRAGQASEYFGDLGGLSRSRQLIMPGTRGTGESADASDPRSYRCDRLAGDV
jgi:hypothetical protein